MSITRFSCQILMKIDVSRQGFSKNAPVSNVKKFRAVGAELFCAGGQRALTKLIFAFHNFAKAPKKYHCTKMN